MTHRFLTTLAAALLLAGGPAVAADDTASDAASGDIDVKESITVDAPPAKVWKAIGDFDAIDRWHPAVESAEIVEGENNEPGARRHLTLAGDGGTIDEELVARDDDRMSYSYRLIEGVLPVRNYRSEIVVKAAHGNATRIVWTGNFDAAEGVEDAKAQEVITGVYTGGLENVKKMMQAD